jgi:hypothetical protein
MKEEIDIVDKEEIDSVDKADIDIVDKAEIDSVEKADLGGPDLPSKVNSVDRVDIVVNVNVCDTDDNSFNK